MYTILIPDCYLVHPALIFSQTSGMLKGKVIDRDIKEELPFVNFLLENHGEDEMGYRAEFIRLVNIASDIRIGDNLSEK